MSIKRVKQLMKGIIITWTAVNPGDEHLTETAISHKKGVYGVASLQLIKLDRRVLFDVPHRWKITLQAHFYNNSVDEFEILPKSECVIQQIDVECMNVADAIKLEPGFHYFKYILEIV